MFLMLLYTRLLLSLFLSVTGRNVQYKTGCHLERGVVKEEISPPPPQLLPPFPPQPPQPPTVEFPISEESSTKIAARSLEF